MPELVIDSFPHHLWPEGLPIFDPKSFVWGGLFIYFYLFLFFRQVLELFLGSWVYGFLLLCFFAFCFLLFLLLCLSASLLYLLLFFSASTFLLYLLLFFSASLLSLLLCFSAFLLLCFAPLLLCLMSLQPLCFSFLLLYSLLFVNTLGETQRNLKEILIRTPDKKPYMKP